MRKLTVKNFSVIKEAELEFGKITVLIGPQASGKSLLCRLAYFFQKVLFELAGNHAVALPDENRWARLLNESFQASFCAFFPTYSWGRESFKIEYEDGNYNPTVTHEALSMNGVVINSPSTLHLSFLTNDFEKIFHQFGDSLKEAIREVPPSNQDARRLENTYIAIARLQQLQSNPAFSVHSYIPDTRSTFSTHNPTYAAANSGRADPIAIAFSRQIDYEYRKDLLSQAKIESISVMEQESRKILGGEIVFDKGNGMVRFREKDGRQLPLTELSSGTRELVPLISLLSKYVFDENADYREIIGMPSSSEPQGALPERLIYVEEPEANVFPSTQYELVRLFAWMVRTQRINLSWVITTHSPYILSAFNNLIEAGQAARNNPTLHDEVARIIPERYWIKEGDFKAYAIEDGKLRSILNESGFIEGNYLDQVSEVIGNEFDELLRLEYDHTKAS